MLGASVQRGLGLLGHAVDWVQDGQAAETALAGEPYDVVLRDLGSPIKPGMEVLRARRRPPGRAPAGRRGQGEGGRAGGSGGHGEGGTGARRLTAPSSPTS
jgi:CheY-like chemotaxis protein